ncbi:MAG: hypothetical protein SVR81_11440, partial [Chloroflexota bacterium]|nr:hypothetical protein [Chloroflexota bacterium]
SYGAGPAEIGVVGGLAVDADGNVWVSDALNNRLMHFTLPELPEVDTDTPLGETNDDTSPDGGLMEGAEPTE